MELFRFRLPRLFLLSYLTAALLFLAISLIDSPKLHLWGIFFISFVYNCSFPFLNCTSHCLNVFLCHHSRIVQCYVFLGSLTLLANFGLVTPIPVGIRVLGVETSLRT